MHVRWTRRRLIAVVGLALTVAATGCQGGGDPDTIVVGSKNFTEQEILGQIMAQMIEAHSDLTVKRNLALGGTMICFSALKAGDLDLYAEYTGTGLVNILEEKVIADPDQAYDAVSKAFDEQYGLTWLDPFGFNNTYTLTMRKDHAARLGIASISDLAAYLNGDGEDLRAGFDAEFFTRPDGYEGLNKHYGFAFPGRPKQMDPGLMYRAAADEAVDVIDGFATDGRIPAFNLVVLEDDKGFFPPYYAAPLVRGEALEAHPEVGDILNRLAGRISNEAMQRMNYQVDEEGRKAADVAREFLVEQGLIPAP